MEIIINPGGIIRCVYEEAIDLSQLGAVQIRRASHVEPEVPGARRNSGGGGWWADLTPMAGPVLGPYPRRSMALAAERRWLEVHWLNQG